jgi:putative redox protein
MSSPRPPQRVVVSWTGDQRFASTRAEGGPALAMDGAGTAGLTPPDALLSALAGCTAIDAVEILTKRRTPPRSFRIDVEGTRVEGVPRRFIHILLTYHIDGEGIDQVHAERALELSITKYCSVRDSLAADLTIEWTLVLNGRPTGQRRAG